MIWGGILLPVSQNNLLTAALSACSQLKVYKGTCEESLRVRTRTKVSHLLKNALE